MKWLIGLGVTGLAVGGGLWWAAHRKPAAVKGVTRVIAAPTAVPPPPPPPPVPESRPGPSPKLRPQVTGGANQPVLYRGASGDLVRALQKRLRVMNPSGTYDAITEVAVREFQRSKNLKADGVVGPDTWAQLGAVRVVGDTAVID